MKKHIAAWFLVLFAISAFAQRTGGLAPSAVAHGKAPTPIAADKPLKFKLPAGERYVARIINDDEPAVLTYADATGECFMYFAGKHQEIVGVMHAGSCNPELLALQVGIRSAGNGKFESKGHPKAKGLEVTVRYPSQWAPMEGERPNIVQKFVGMYNGVNSMLMLQISSAGAQLDADCNALEWQEASSAADTGARATNKKVIKHDGQPAFLVDVDQRAERAGATFFGASKMMTVCYGKNTIVASCGVLAALSQEQATREMAVLAPVCHQFFNSLVLMDKYRVSGLPSHP